MARYTEQPVDVEAKEDSAQGNEVGSGFPAKANDNDVFDDEEGHEIHYKTMSWQLVAALMIAEIVSNGMLSLPNALATVGMVPAVILIVFLGIFALFTSKLLVDFKLNHPNVHSMGDAGFILFGPIGREILAFGTVVFSIFALGSEILSGQLALQVLSNNGLCAVYLAAITAVICFLISLPRTLSNLTWYGICSCLSILTAGLVAMIGAGANSASDRVVKGTVPQSFINAFLAITNPVFAYAGHFMFFILISEMKHPKDAMKAAWVLQTFATVFYVVFAVVLYAYIGSTVNSLALLSLPPIWSKVTLGLALPNFLMAGGLYGHVPAKLIFVRIFRGTKHVYSHTILGWTIWISLCLAAAVIAFVFATAVPIFSFLIGLSASLFAAWYTYGLAGFFYIHDVYYPKGGIKALKKHPWMVLVSIFTIFAGAFICVAGTYAFIKLLVEAYRNGEISKPFTC